MTYAYQCPLCKIEAEINKPASEVDRVEHCHICESEMKRVYNAAMIKTSDGTKV